MKPFLKELAEKIVAEKTPLDQITMVFPNRRASLYFKKHLGDQLSKPSFAPRLLNIEEFISGLSTARVPDKLELIHRLYQMYTSLMPSTFTSGENEGAPEPFDRFYFWGDMLLRDFEEIDKYMVQADHLFKDLRNQKELDSSFDYLTEEQKEFLRKFWFGFDDHLTESKQKFITVWNRLFTLYDSYRKDLQSKGLAYEGMIHREVAEQLLSNQLKAPDYGHLKFVGFNALTLAEERIISWFVEKREAKVFWDADQYYVNDVRQEAGSFLKLYQNQDILKATFETFPANLVKPKSLKVISAAQAMGQAKLMAQMLEQQLEAGAKPEETLIVLPDEKMLMPVLHGISDKVEKLNVTMGFSLSNTPVFNLVELLVELQTNRKQDHFNHRQVLALLGHPYIIAADPAIANAKRKEILTHNWVMIPESFLATSLPLHRTIFAAVEANILDYVRQVIHQVGALEKITDLDREFAFHFLKLINRMEEVIGTSHQSGRLEKPNALAKSFLRLFRQLVRAQKIPFTGEPLKGLQIMGVLETRNLDFKNVFILSLNEGAFPSFGGKGSYVPFNIRKAYGLPTIEHQDAIYSYLFYRVLQRAENVFLFYNSETDQLGQGEMSRYLQQLIFESPLKIEREVLHNPVQPRAIESITIKKDNTVLEALAKLNEGTARFRGISPSALNSYIECRLKFYFRYIAGVKEPKLVEDDLDARVLGNFLHEVMEGFYKRIRERKRNKLIEAGDFVGKEKAIDDQIDHEFIKEYRLDPTRKVTYEGQRLVVKEVVRRFALKILENDEKHAPFVMEAVEQEGLLYNVKISHAPGFVVLGGKIDRVDRKENQIRVIDYKTGKDKLDFDSIESLFERTTNRNKAAFQTMLYALLYRNNARVEESFTIVPGLINRSNLFDDAFQFGLKMKKDLVEDATPLLPEFEARLRILLEEIYDPETTFDQTVHTETCRLCPYQNICYR